MGLPKHLRYGPERPGSRANQVLNGAPYGPIFLAIKIVSGTSIEGDLCRPEDGKISIWPAYRTELVVYLSYAQYRRNALPGMHQILAAISWRRPRGSGNHSDRTAGSFTIEVPPANFQLSQCPAIPTRWTKDQVWMGQKHEHSKADFSGQSRLSVL
jgi:hypothetical protein